MPGQIYTALSTVKTYYYLYCVGKLEKHAIKLDKEELFEYELLKQSDLLSTLKGNTIAVDTIAVFILDVRSLSKLIY